MEILIWFAVALLFSAVAVALMNLSDSMDETAKDLEKAVDELRRIRGMED